MMTVQMCVRHCKQPTWLLLVLNALLNRLSQPCSTNSKAQQTTVIKAFVYKKDVSAVLLTGCGKG